MVRMFPGVGLTGVPFFLLTRSMIKVTGYQIPQEKS